MKDATIIQEQETQEEKQEEQQLYQQGKYPSIIDTDDLVFEIGKQTIGNLNKEKLLDNLLKKSTAIEKALVETRNANFAVEKKSAGFETSNKEYVENNQKLDAELIKIREELEKLKAEANNTKLAIEKKSIEFELSNKKYIENNQRLDAELVKIRKELERSKKAVKEFEDSEKVREKIIKKF